MIIYRLTNHLILDGKGAAKQLANRWNSPGTKMIYTAGSVAVAKGEISRRIPLAFLPQGFLILTIEIPDDSIDDVENLPDDWDKVPPGNGSKQIGDQFIAEENALTLKVPSVYDKNSFDYLINPDHPRMNEVRIIKEEPLYL